jgi:hypothetical protein
MKFNKTLGLIFAAKLKPSTPARFIHFGSPIPSKGETFFAAESFDATSISIGRHTLIS